MNFNFSFYIGRNSLESEHSRSFGDVAWNIYFWFWPFNKIVHVYLCHIYVIYNIYLGKQMWIYSYSTFYRCSFYQQFLIHPPHVLKIFLADVNFESYMNHFQFSGKIYVPATIPVKMFIHTFPDLQACIPGDLSPFPVFNNVINKLLWDKECQE